MKISENWLREWVNPAAGTEELLSQLTMAGLEVEGIEPAGADIQGVVVGEVVSLEAHPNADKLSLCQVSDGKETVPVICGAKNVRQGLKVIFAKVGAKLPDINIKKAKLRGIESQGMLCSASELKLAESSDGIFELPQDAPVGTNIIEYLQLNDQIIEIDLTPNRGDCLSLAGVAREVSAINNQAIEIEISPEINESLTETFPVELQAPEACSRYVGRIIRSIDPLAKTPMWMQEKLRRCDLRPISPVVDITNYVMMELGQPMHGFDFDKLAGGIQVRRARAGEKLTLLDQSEVECREDTLLIADHEKPLAMAGVMGGLDSSVQSETRNVFFEAAFFSPIDIAGKARSYGMHTDSSHRFERGVDSQLQLRAIQRATELLIEIAGGEAGPVIDCSDENFLPKQAEVTLRYDRIKRLLGINVERQDVVQMLQGLGMQIAENEAGWLVKPPSYRFDINIEADLIEEVGRMVGYNNIPGTREAAHIRVDSFSETKINLNQIRDVLVEQGFHEAITYSFVSPELQAILDPGQETLPLSNPISSDMSVMRTRLLPGLIQALQHNVNRQQSRVRLFESGLCFIPDDTGLIQRPHIAAVITGNLTEEGLYSNPGSVDFFDIKGNLESILRLSSEDNYRFVRSENPVLHPGQSADIVFDGEIIGFLGALHPSLTNKLNLNQAVFVFEIDLKSILSASLAKFSELSRYPSIRRDISLSVDADINVQTLIDCIYSIESEILQEVFVFDVYTGKEVRNNRKSVALGLILQDFSRTLVDEDVEKLVIKVLAQLKNQYNAVLREN
ncbi:MAG: phenylalanine--tRNA ligase subunit beta [Gammaproteobacteria bacterium]|nr:phenylalanine--tRNA ligase subunit beta [Gammaproteobacteria bacterium]